MGGLFSDRRGVAAVEFALIVPLLLAMYFVTMEVAQAIETSKKVSRVGNMVADLVAQQPKISSLEELEAIMSIGEATLQPYNRSKPSIVITAIEVTNDATPKIQVVWSHKLVARRLQPRDSEGGADNHLAAGPDSEGQFPDPGGSHAGIRTRHHLGGVVASRRSAWLRPSMAFRWGNLLSAAAHEHDYSLRGLQLTGSVIC